MRNVEDFEPFILPYAPHVPSELIQHSLREAIVAFMRETKIAEATTTFETQDRVMDYHIEIPECHRLIKVKKAVAVRKNQSGKEVYHELLGGDGGHYDVHLRMGRYPIMTLTDVSRAPQTIQFTYYWAIGRDDCEVPDYIYEDFMDTIVAGTLLHLAQTPGNENLMPFIEMYRKNWFDGIQKAKIEKSGGKPKRMLGAPILRRRGRGTFWR